MTLSRLAALVLLLVVAGLGSAARIGLLSSLQQSPSPENASHVEGTSCPDPDGDAQPCGATCPCACCPHRPLAAALPPVPVPMPGADRDLGGLTSGDDPDAFWRHELHPTKVRNRIFRPPRA